MPQKSIRAAKTFPPAEQKLVLVVGLKGDSLERRVLVDFDNDLVDKFWKILAIANYSQWLAMGPKGNPPSADIQVLADLKTGELEGMRGRDREKYYDFFEPPGRRRGGVRVYGVTRVHYCGMAAIPPWMINEEE